MTGAAVDLATRLVIGSPVLGSEALGSEALGSALRISIGFGSNSEGSADRAASSTGRGRGSTTAAEGGGIVTTEPNIGEG